MSISTDTGRFAALGLTYAGTIVAMGALGYWLDVVIDTPPWFLLLGILLGAVGGFVSLVKKVSGATSTRSGGAPPPKP